MDDRVGPGLVEEPRDGRGIAQIRRK